MAETPERLSRTLWISVGLLIIILAVAFAFSRMAPSLRGTAALPVFGQIADFTLTNQSGQGVMLANLRGRVWVADIIFTRCAGPCLRMTRQMKSLQDAFPPSSRAKLVTLTTDPEFDTPTVLKKYAERFEANPERWMFLTGTKNEIVVLAVDSLKLTAIAKKPEERENPEDLFIHSTLFVVVDQAARWRAVFETDGEGIEWTNVQSRILATVQQLEGEQ